MDDIAFFRRTKKQVKKISSSDKVTWRLSAHQVGPIDVWRDCLHSLHSRNPNACDDSIFTLPLNFKHQNM